MDWLVFTSPILTTHLFCSIVLFLFYDTFPPFIFLKNLKDFNVIVYVSIPFLLFWSKFSFEMINFVGSLFWVIFFLMYFGIFTCNPPCVGEVSPLSLSLWTYSLTLPAPPRLCSLPLQAPFLSQQCRTRSFICLPFSIVTGTAGARGWSSRPALQRHNSVLSCVPRQSNAALRFSLLFLPIDSVTRNLGFVPSRAWQNPTGFKPTAKHFISFLIHHEVSLNLWSWLCIFFHLEYNFKILNIQMGGYVLTRNLVCFIL